MQKKCKTCSEEFEVRPEDKIFYEQVNAPEPNYCPDCRAARRLAFRNERTLYKRACDLCKKEGISLYTKDTLFPVYCHDCWWSDKWDPRDFAKDYDFNKSFFEQYKELQHKVPRLSLMAFNNVRSDYTNGSAENKDCYLVFAADYNEDCLYGRLLQRDKQCVDCAYLHESELCYECIDCRQCFKCMFSEQCQSSSDLLFCYNMRDSQNCILCSNGRHISNSILNVKYSKEEFEKKKAEILSSHGSIEAAKKEFQKLKEQSIVKFTVQTKCHNVTGNHIHNCYDGISLFDTYDAKNCSYMTDCESPIDSMDCNNYYYKPAFGYNIVGALEGSKLKNSAFVFYCNEVEYCESCHHLSNALGCIGVRKGNYMILNKEYLKDDYLKLKAKIDEQMKTDENYGQFFSPDIAPFGYNETLAKEYYPLSRDEALSRGYRWQESTTGTFGKETITEENIPKSIISTPDSITGDILACTLCGKNFRITEAELSFYRRMGIPLPHQDFECRHQARMHSRTPRKLFDGACMCARDGHGHPSASSGPTAGKCAETFKTPYSPTTSATIYCENCYQREVS